MVVPYSNLHSVTSKPLGLTRPLSVAVVGASELAGSVLTVGGSSFGQVMETSFDHLFGEAAGRTRKLSVCPGSASGV